ncbi:hypothetical protein DVA86_20530 [Streptomyces armeniacus]|uniref:Uncharacterized protein n=1 Tax=Streptomyces armeniacus TaxID=83291 RepID=A0A345XSR5_9ACTN|nr:hypothetical protein [Streptomyces armeniacus]AXK34681.1 hypothetical protein DVA86_20530 [Streptomyces armeniacus]
MTRLGPLRGPIALARNAVGRAATVAGTGALAAGTFAPDAYATSITGTIVCAGWATLWSATLPRTPVGNTATALYLAPSWSLAGLLTAQHFVPGVDWWWQLLADAAWTVGVWKARPARSARVLVGREKSLTPTAIEESKEILAQDTVQGGPQHPMAAYWAQRVAIEDGAAPHTVLEQIVRTGPESMTAVIRSTLPGKPVPKIDLLELSAAINWPEDDIAITPVPRQGAGVRRLVIGQAPEQAMDLNTAWEKHIAPKGMPGTVITQIRTVDIPDPEEEGAKELRA